MWNKDKKWNSLSSRPVWKDTELLQFSHMIHSLEMNISPFFDFLMISQVKINHTRRGKLYISPLEKEAATVFRCPLIPKVYVVWVFDCHANKDISWILLF